MVHLKKFLFVPFNLIRFTFAKNRGQQRAFLRIGVRRDGGSSAVELKIGYLGYLLGFRKRTDVGVCLLLTSFAQFWTVDVEFIYSRVLVK